MTNITVAPSDGESPDAYMASFPHVKLADLAAAAQLQPLLANLYDRDTPTGYLSAKMLDDTATLSCVPK